MSVLLQGDQPLARLQMWPRYLSVEHYQRFPVREMGGSEGTEVIVGSLALLLDDLEDLVESGLSSSVA